MHPHPWQIRDRILHLGRRPLVMGIVNVTPDSFSDGGQHATTDAAVAHALHLVEQGADLLDIGGESTRPGSQPVTLDVELQRVVPVIERLAAQTNVPLSVDTSKAAVARASMAAGAHLINDVTAMIGDADMPAAVRDSGAGVILMHMQGTPATMQQNPTYDDVVAEVSHSLEERLHAAVAFGIAADRVVLDPGIGFGKTRAHNIALLTRLAELQRLGRPVCLGVSRKGVLGHLLDRPVDQRLAGSLAVVCHTMSSGAVQIVRVHDVAETRDVVRVWEVLSEGTEHCENA